MVDQTPVAFPAEFARLQAEMERQMADANWRKKTTQLTGVNCFVCYLDLDGFKERVWTAPHDLFETYQTQRQYLLASFFMANASASGSTISLNHYDKMLWPYLFSDSWFFATIDSSEEALRQISSVAAGVFMRCWEIGFPAHGAIAEGPLWWRPDLQIMLGPGIAKAFLAAESMDCFGVAAHPDLLARGQIDAFTAPYKVRQKKLRFGIFPTYKTTSFCRLYAHNTNRTWNTEHYLSRFENLARTYCIRPDAKPHVIARYDRSKAIVAAMVAR